jgi:glycosyltransferase involved in cell wall biosynthesis
LKRLAAFVPNLQGHSPGQRVRIETWAPFLERGGWEVTLFPFESARLHEVLYRPGHVIRKAREFVACYDALLRRVMRGVGADVYFIYREAALIGPAVVERLLSRTGVPIVYDIDDPVFLPYVSPINRGFSRLKCPGKTHTLLRLSRRVISINEILAAYARRFNPAVTVVPNCIDVDRVRPGPPRKREGPVRFGWVGSHSTAANLREIAEPLARLQASHGVALRFIGSGAVDLPGVSYERVDWSPEAERGSLEDCDVGLLPVSDHPWNDWKFYLKAVQYMALGLPVVARRKGSNDIVVQDGVSGFLVETPTEWYEALSRLATDEPLRAAMGAAARRTVVERFSLAQHAPRVLEVIEQARRGESPGLD